MFPSLIIILILISASLAPKHDNLRLPMLFSPKARNLIPADHVPQLDFVHDSSTPEARSRDAYNNPAAMRASSTINEIEEGFLLSKGHFKPVYGYQPSQREAIQAHLTRTNSRFHKLYTSDPDERPWSMFASPAYLRKPGPYDKEPTLVLLKIFEDGDVQPMGYAGATESPYRAIEDDLWKNLVQVTTTSARKLSRELGVPLRLRPL
ncbi:uncharacterized protein UTRI_06202 [Ustilago trichophora]|uniref:Effector family protein Eff1 n=1 Tax=Ustilago trichophora TaxID=86804 RepID=A0A5C3EF23_9BASI|nr:uncharacterized protein UTRI_06202 [Ustilago trichophora]